MGSDAGGGILGGARVGAQVMVWIAGGALVLMSFVITLETLVRKFAGFSFGSVNEMSSYLFAISSAWALGYALVEGAHIRITMLRNVFGPRVRAAFDIVAWLVFLVVFAVIAYRATELAWDSYLTNARAPTPNRTQLFLPQALWAFGMFTAVLAAVLLGVQSLRLRSTRPLAPVEEAEAELENLK
ncbi:TRAP transporter small permease subunit [Mesorhizobium sp. 1B3]|uniref:TRAP transporter small permease subunit n=1 Tax=Mesorhizobium sp. 1B3 TaxID=3243599 RepID=UPI003D99275B